MPNAPESIEEWGARNGYVAVREPMPGFVLAVGPLLTGTWRLNVGDRNYINHAY